MGFHDFLVLLVVFGCEQVKFRPKNTSGIPKCSGRRNSVGSGEEAKAGKHDMNLISELKFL